MKKLIREGKIKFEDRIDRDYQKDLFEIGITEYEAWFKHIIYLRAYDYIPDYRPYYRTDLKTYYEVGKLLALAGKHYGEGVIKEYSKRLTRELGKGYNLSSLKRMRQFYLIIRKGATLSHQLSWSHYIELITVNYVNKINYYIRITE